MSTDIAEPVALVVANEESILVLVKRDVADTFASVDKAIRQMADLLTTAR